MFSSTRQWSRRRGSSTSSSRMCSWRQGSQDDLEYDEVPAYDDASHGAPRGGAAGASSDEGAGNGDDEDEDEDA